MVAESTAYLCLIYLVIHERTNGGGKIAFLSLSAPKSRMGKQGCSSNNIGPYLSITLE